MAGTGTDPPWSPESGDPRSLLGDPARAVSAEARLQLLVEASSHLSDTLDLRAVARGLARSVVPVLADRSHVDLVESLFHPERGAVADSTVLFRVACVDVFDREAMLRRDEWVAYPPGSAAAVALSSGVARGEGAEATPESAVRSAAGPRSGPRGGRAGPGRRQLDVRTGRRRPGRGDRVPGRPGPRQRSAVRRGARDGRRPAALPPAECPAAGHRSRHRAPLSAGQP